MRLLSVFIAGCSLVAATNAQVSVLTARNDNFRTGENSAETILNQQNVRPGSFGKLATKLLDRAAQSQPLVVSGLNVGGQVRNVVFVTTYGNQVYAFDADDFDTAAPLWKTNLEETVRSRGGSGMLATPVIDPATNTLYCTSRYIPEDAGNTPGYTLKLFALDIATGAVKAQKLISAVVPGIGDATDGQGNVHFQARYHFQRPSLLLHQGRIYLCFGSSGHDERPYHGWIMVYSAATLDQLSAICITPDTSMGAIWQAGSGPAVDTDGYVYVVTANGTPTAPADEIGNSVLKLSPGDTPTLLDYFTPYNTQFLNQYDLDLGSGGIMHIPGTNFVVTGSKHGPMYVMDRNNLGGRGTTSDNVVSIARVDGHIHGTPALYRGPEGTRLIVWAEEDFLKSFAVGPNGLVLPDIARSSFRAPDGMPGGMVSVSHHNATLGTGLAWVTMPLIGDGLYYLVPGILRAFNADTMEELWNSELQPVDEVSQFAKFHPPTVANGKVYLSSYTNALHIYGLLGVSKPAPPFFTSAQSDTGVGRIYWSESPNAKSYIIERTGSNINGPWVEVARDVQNFSYVDSGIGMGVRNYYRVKAVNDVGESAPGPASEVWGSNQRSTTGFAFGAFSIEDPFVFNGNAKVVDRYVEISNGANPARGSFFHKDLRRNNAWKAKFRFRFYGDVNGLTFTVQRNFTGTATQASSLGGGGGELGYGPDPVSGYAIRQSAAVKIARDAANPGGVVGVYRRGRTVQGTGDSLTGTGVDLRSGNTYELLLSYQTSALRVIIKDLKTKTSFTKWYRLSLPSELSTTNGYVGITGSTGPGGKIQIYNLVLAPL